MTLGLLSEAYFAYVVANMNNDFDIKVNYLTDHNKHEDLPRCYVCDFIEAKGRHFEVRNDSTSHSTGDIFIELDSGAGEESWAARFARLISNKTPVAMYMAYVNSDNSSVMFMNCRRLIEYFWFSLGQDMYHRNLAVPSRDELFNICKSVKGWEMSGTTQGFGVKIKMSEMPKSIGLNIISYDKLRVEGFREFEDNFNRRTFKRLSEIEGLGYNDALERFKNTCCKLSSEKAKLVKKGVFAPRKTNGELELDKAGAAVVVPEIEPVSLITPPVTASILTQKEVEKYVRKDVKDSDFVHLHSHSFYSLLDGVSSPDLLAKRAKELGQPAIAITDHGYMFGNNKMQNACNEHGIKAIHGFEAYYVDDVSVRERHMYHLILLAANDTGWMNLLALCSCAGSEGFYYKPRIDTKMLGQHREGLIVLSACYKSPVSFHLSEEGYDPDKARNNMRTLKLMFGDRFYNEVMSIGMPAYDSIVPRILQMANDEGVRTVVTNDCLVPGTMIFTKNGAVPIEDIKAGDLVLTHKNRFKKVTAINKRIIKNGDNVYNANVSLGNQGLTSTGNHPLSAIVKKSKHQNVFKNREWVNMDKLSMGDYLSMPKTTGINANVPGSDFIDLTHWVQATISNTNLGLKIVEGNFISKGGMGKSEVTVIPTKIALDDTFLYVLGKYLADGNTDAYSSKVSFAFNISESRQVKLVGTFFKSFGLSVYQPVVGNGITLSFSSVVFSTLFRKMFGTKSDNKVFPKISPETSLFDSWSREQLRKILLGYIDGDGHIRKSGQGFMVYTVSKTLGWQLSFIFGLFGLVAIPTVRYHNKVVHKNPRANPEKWNIGYSLDFSKGYMNRFFNKVDGIISRVKAKEESDFYRIRISNIKTITYDGFVYNFSVEDDESYVANGVCVHNCHYAEESGFKTQEILFKMHGGALEFEAKKLYVKSRADMLADSMILREHADNTLEVNDRIEFKLEYKGYKFPSFDISKDREYEAYGKRS